MVQQLRTDEPRYVCIIPVDSFTGNQDEEFVSFGVSVDDAKSKAEYSLAENYGCDSDEIYKLMQQSRTEPLSQWCSQPRSLLGSAEVEEESPHSFR